MSCFGCCPFFCNNVVTISDGTFLLQGQTTIRESGFFVVNVLGSLIKSTEYLNLPGNNYYWSLFNIKRSRGPSHVPTGRARPPNPPGGRGAEGDRKEIPIGLPIN